MIPQLIPVLSGGPDAYLDFDFRFGQERYWINRQRYGEFGLVPGATSTGGAGFGQALRNGAWSGNHPDGTPLIGDGGLGVWGARTNLFLNSATPATQSITLGATGTYTITCFDAGSVAVAAGTATITGAGTATPGSPLVITCTATGTITCTVSGSPYCVNVTAGANINGPPIFTTGVAATRTAVAQSVGGANLPPAGAFYAEWVQPIIQTTTRTYVANVQDLTNSRFSLYASNGSGQSIVALSIGDGTTVTGLTAAAPAAGTINRVVGAYDTTSARMAFTFNGSDQTFARQLAAATITNAQIGLGQRGEGVNNGQLNSTLRRLVVLPRFPEAAERIAITTGGL